MVPCAIYTIHGHRDTKCFNAIQENNQIHAASGVSVAVV